MAKNPFVFQTEAIEEKLGYVFRKKDLLIMSFTHRSFLNENREIATHHNERLEFLGDAVLGFIVSEFLYMEYPLLPEGELSFLRSKLVEASSCCLYVKKLQLEPYLLLGKGEKSNEGKGRESILADLFEAILGAIYLDGGIRESRRFILRFFEEEMRHWTQNPLQNWKALLQEYIQKRFQQPPIYKVLKEEGPSHQKIFVVGVYFEEILLGQGEGFSKKEAEQKAAYEGCRYYSLE